MEKEDQLMQMLEDMERSLEIACSTLSIISEKRENEAVAWTLIGVMERLEKIKESLVFLNGNFSLEGGASA